MRRWSSAISIFAALMASASGCDGPVTAADGGQACATARDCDDGVFCNGAEACDPSAASADARGCVEAAAPPCMASQTCDEAIDACLSDCEVAPDADGDGSDAVECGGADCDDADRDRFPGNLEVCDPGHHDEDCDPTTFGVRDADGDGYPDARCCNVSGDEMRCGSDCDDAVGAVHPGEAESCDTFDNDCDGSVDEGVESSYYRDTDGDGYGDGSVAPVMACTAPDSTYVENGTDCDDGERLINPATSELCDELDNNCDGRVDEAGTRNFFRDADEDGYGDPDSIVSLLTCEPPEGYVAIGNDCDDADPDVHPGAPELCNRRDDNCSLPGVGAGGVDPSEDADEDGHAPRGTTLCSGGLAADDCDDTEPAVHPGAADVCDGLDNDCVGGADDEPAATVWCGPSQTCTAGACHDRTDVALAMDRSCAITAGEVWCWGDPTTGSATPERVPGTAGVVQIDALASSSEMICGRTEAGAVLCWPALGGSATAVAGVTDAVDVAVGEAHACARRRGGQVLCWGQNNRGQLGDGSISTSSTPVTVVGITDAIELDLGGTHSCVRSASGGLSCWGRNVEGQLGEGSSTNRLVPTPVASSGDLRGVTGGANHTCALEPSGAAWCWGSGSSGQLGNGGGAGTTAPSRVVDVSDFARLSAGLDVTCGVRAGGQAACWGGILRFALGEGAWPATNRTRPVPVVDLTDASAVAVGRYASCVRRNGGEVSCFGTWIRGLTGESARSPRSIRSGISTVAAQEFGGCTQASDGSVACWGPNADGRLGDGTSTDRPSPVAITALMGADEIAPGMTHGCARVGGAVTCWGRNDAGQLGDGSFVAHAAPAPVVGLTDASQIAVGCDHTCAIRADGTMVCWGDNSYGQLGDGSSMRSASPVAVDGIAGAVEVGAGCDFTCARLDSGQIRCWGIRRMLGIGDGTSSPYTATDTGPGILDATDLSTSAIFSCAAQATGVISCWGEGVGGQLGDGGTSYRAAPVRVASIFDAIGVATGGEHACARRSSGVLSCWGRNQEAQLGDGTTTMTSMPVTIPGVTSPASLSLGRSFSCALSSSGDLSCWGGRWRGEVGLGVQHVVPLP